MCLKKKSNKTVVSATKRIYTYAYLRAASWHAYQDADEKEEGRFYNNMISIVFSAFTLEAYLNQLGEALFRCWSKVERKLGPEDKLHLIAERIPFHLDFGKRPFQSFRPIIRFRNYMAHGRSEFLQEETAQLLLPEEEPDLPDPEWKSEITLANAKRYLDDTKAMIESLHSAAGLSQPLWTPETAAWWSSPD